jgi:hypothetical protein
VAVVVDRPVQVRFRGLFVSLSLRMSFTPQGQPTGPGQPQSLNQPPQYPPPGGYGYGQFQPPMPPPQPKRRTGLVVLLIVGALVLVAGGAGAYYFFPREAEQGDITAAGDEASASAEPEASESASEVIPCDLNAPDLGTSTPLPGESWSPIEFETGAGYVSDASVGCLVMHDDDQMSYIEAGAWPEASFYDPERLGESAAFVANSWGESEHVGGADAEGKVVGAPEAGEMDIDGHAAGWSEIRVTWQPAAGEPETYEDIGVLLIDIDGTTAFVAIASIPEVGEGLYEEATQALLSTTFTA